MTKVFLKIEIESSGDAFQAEDPQEELATILYDLGSQVRVAQDEEGGPVRDANGNTVGAWALRVTD